MPQLRYVCLLTAGLFGAFSLTIDATGADEPDAKAKLTSQLESAKARATSQTYQLQYRFLEGETMRWKVVHLGTTEVTVQGNTQTSKVRTVSTKQWKVKQVDAKGNMTFVHSVEDMKAWQKVSDRPEVRYDSQTDKEVPAQYAAAAKTIGVPIATVTIAPTGTVVERDKGKGSYDLGLGGITVPLPDGPVKIGKQWYVPDEVRVPQIGGRIKRVKTRLVYTLKTVKTGVATISVETQVLTPVNDPETKSKLIQQLIKGEIKFDLDAGRILSRRIDWDETVVGFRGSDSLMKYLARFTEELIADRSLASNPESGTR